jgi:GH15 family glucan-1,4-alpha-glucosidase
VRDTAFTLQALFNTGHLREIERFLDWIGRIVEQEGAERMQIMYGLRGERELPEATLRHLDGYKGSRPVRVGNAAFQQKQMDIYGELMDAALKLSDYVGKIRAEQWPGLRQICDYVAAHWREPDYGIWEVRGDPGTSSIPR